MTLRLAPFHDLGLDEPALRRLLDDQADRAAFLHRLWSYYRNPLSPTPNAHAHSTNSSAPAGRWYDLAQAAALPTRLRRADRPADHAVVENDIAWRIDALVDFVFGKPVRVRSEAADPDLRSRIEAVLERVLENSGGMPLLRDAALLGSVHGWVDLILRTDDLSRPTHAAPELGPAPRTRDPLERAAAALRIELVEAPRSAVLLDPADYRRIRAYIIRPNPADPAADPPARRHPTLARLAKLSRPRPRHTAQDDPAADHLEILSAYHQQLYTRGRLLRDAPNPLRALPVVHVQNGSQPLRYEGVSDVEPLIPLQDELNARLSDRAHRVTLQSFNMYLAKGLDNVIGAGGVADVAPGRVWATDNPDAEITSFGGDGHSPSETQHIDEIREALDKASSVSPAVLGVIRAKLGHLSSVNALRITMQGVLAKTERKRAAYGRGVAEVLRLALHALDHAGVLRTRPEDRGVKLEFEDPLPESEDERLAAALKKRDLGVPADTILRELGYDADPVVT